MWEDHEELKSMEFRSDRYVLSYWKEYWNSEFPELRKVLEKRIIRNLRNNALNLRKDAIMIGLKIGMLP